MNSSCWLQAADESKGKPAAEPARKRIFPPVREKPLTAAASTAAADPALTRQPSSSSAKGRDSARDAATDSKQGGEKGIASRDERELARRSRSGAVGEAGSAAAEAARRPARAEEVRRNLPLAESGKTTTAVAAETPEPGEVPEQAPAAPNLKENALTGEATKVTRGSEDAGKGKQREASNRHEKGSSRREEVRAAEDAAAAKAAAAKPAERDKSRREAAEKPSAEGVTTLHLA